MKKILSRKTFRLRNFSKGSWEVFSQSSTFFLAIVLIQVFYAWNLRHCMVFLSYYEYILGSKDFVLLWPVFWAKFTGLKFALDFTIVWNFLFGLAALALPRIQFFRIGIAIGALLQASMEYSYGDIGHAGHMTLWTLIIFAFIPGWGKDPTRVSKQRALNFFFFAQAQIALFYTASGIWKIAFAFYQLAMGQPNAFNIDGFSRILAQRLLNGNTDTLLGNFLIINPVFGFLGFWAAVGLEVFCVWAIFFREFHRPLGIGLIAFHLMAAISLAPVFHLNVALLGIFFVCSPFGFRKNRRSDLNLNS